MSRIMFGYEVRHATWPGKASALQGVGHLLAARLYTCRYAAPDLSDFGRQKPLSRSVAFLLSARLSLPLLLPPPATAGLRRRAQQAGAGGAAWLLTLYGRTALVPIPALLLPAH